MTGSVHLVGAGPGDPELITVRGHRLIEQADAVVHDRLVGTGLLELIPADSLRIDVGKAGYRHTVAQPEINATLIRLARAGLEVVRLKGGDPFVFGRGGEEAEALRAAGIPFDVVPGITAGIAGPAFAGIPVTHRGVARSVAFVTGHEDTSSGGPPIDWSSLAGIDTLVVYMAGRTAAVVARSLLAAGRSPNAPTAFIFDASLPSQEVRQADLGSLAAAGAGPTDGRAALLVIGEVVTLALRSAPIAPEQPQTQLDLIEVSA
jgi:uroporphyrinogen III methyltransferase/synthase